MHATDTNNSCCSSTPSSLCTEFLDVPYLPNANENLALQLRSRPLPLNRSSALFAGAYLDHIPHAKGLPVPGKKYPNTGGKRHAEER